MKHRQVFVQKQCVYKVLRLIFLSITGRMMPLKCQTNHVQLLKTLQSFSTTLRIKFKFLHVAQHPLLPGPSPASFLPFLHLHLCVPFTLAVLRCQVALNSMLPQSSLLPPRTFLLPGNCVTPCYLLSLRGYLLCKVVMTKLSELDALPLGIP